MNLSPVIETGRKYHIHLRTFVNRDGFEELFARGGVTLIWWHDSHTDTIQTKVAVCSHKDVYSKKIGREVAEKEHPYEFPFVHFVRNELRDVGLEDIVYLDNFPIDVTFPQSSVEQMLIWVLQEAYSSYFEENIKDFAGLDIYIPA